MHDLTCVDIVGVANTDTHTKHEEKKDCLACFDLTKVIYVGAFDSMCFQTACKTVQSKTEIYRELSYVTRDFLSMFIG